MSENKNKANPVDRIDFENFLHELRTERDCQKGTELVREGLQLYDKMNSALEKTHQAPNGGEDKTK
jgi:hypothetical protein